MTFVVFFSVQQLPGGPTGPGKPGAPEEPRSPISQGNYTVAQFTRSVSASCLADSDVFCHR